MITVSDMALSMEIQAVAQQINEQRGSADSRVAWETLYRRLATAENGGESLVGLGMGYAMPLLFAAYRLEMYNNDFASASRWLAILFSHPEVHNVEPDSQATMAMHQAGCGLCLGEITGAVFQIRSTFQTTDRRQLKYRLRYCIYVLTAEYFPRVELREAAPLELIDLANDMFRLWKQRQRPAGLLTPAATFGDLRDFLNANIPR